MKFNKIIIAGNLTRDPEMKYLSAEKAVTNFSIAVNEMSKNKDDANVSYFDVVVFSRQAETCNEYLSKGSPVLIEGRLQQRRWVTNDGTKKSKIEIIASNIQFLSSGAATKKVSSDNDGFDTVSDDDIPF